MARFEIYIFNDLHVMDLQNDYVIIPGSRVVAPLLQRAHTPEPTRGLHPKVTLDETEYLLATHLLAATPVADLKLADVSARFERDEITRALDLLFQGY